jgi:hypothetical protein
MPVAGKKPSKRSKGTDLLDSVKGWRPVETGDDFLLGAEEYGFMGLEVLDPALASDMVLEGLPAGGLEEGEGGVKGKLQEKKKKKKQGEKAKSEKKEKRKRAEDPAAEGGGNKDADPAALRAEIAALTAENEALRFKTGEKPAKKKKGTAEKKQRPELAPAPSATEQPAKKTKKGASATLSDGPGVDTSAWNFLELDPSIMGALSRLGFSAPTHVQAECLPAAIRDRRDIIGAAQTVGDISLFQVYSVLGGRMYVECINYSQSIN